MNRPPARIGWPGEGRPRGAGRRPRRRIVRTRLGQTTARGRRGVSTTGRSVPGAAARTRFRRVVRELGWLADRDMSDSYALHHRAMQNYTYQRRRRGAVAEAHFHLFELEALIRPYVAGIRGGRSCSAHSRAAPLDPSRAPLDTRPNSPRSEPNQHQPDLRAPLDPNPAAPDAHPLPTRFVRAGPRDGVW